MENLKLLSSCVPAVLISTFSFLMFFLGNNILKILSIFLFSILTISILTILIYQIVYTIFSITKISISGFDTYFSKRKRYLKEIEKEAKKIEARNKEDKIFL